MKQSTGEERFVGVDFHKEFAVVVRLKPDGSRCGKTERYPSTPEGLARLRTDCTAADHVVVEATYHWALFADAFEDFDGDLALAHPAKNRLIAESRNKNDKVDARVLADLRRTNFLAQAWIAPREVREARELLRYRCGLVRILTMLKNRVWVLLAKAGRTVQATELFGPGGMAELAQLDLGATRNELLRGYVQAAQRLKEVVAAAEELIAGRVAGSPQAQLVDSIKGFGALSALTVVSEIGDIKRFCRAGKLVSYAGLAPVNRESAGVLRHGRISKQGSPWLRWILVEACTHACAAYPQLAALQERVTKHQGGRKNAGRIAVARQLLVSIYHVLKKNEPFDARRIGKQGGGKKVAGKRN